MTGDESSIIGREGVKPKTSEIDRIGVHPVYQVVQGFIISGVEVDDKQWSLPLT